VEQERGKWQKWHVEAYFKKSHKKFVFSYANYTARSN
jgi:hypothetical protein